MKYVYEFSSILLEKLYDRLVPVRTFLTIEPYVILKTNYSENCIENTFCIVPLSYVS